jgi:hypothetical protein
VQKRTLIRALVGLNPTFVSPGAIGRPDRLVLEIRRTIDIDDGDLLLGEIGGLDRVGVDEELAVFADPLNGNNQLNMAALSLRIESAYDVAMGKIF